jgi:hypothetical protein
MRIRCRKKRDIINSTTHHRPIKGGSARKQTNVIRLKNVIDKIMFGGRKVGCLQIKFFTYLYVIVSILMCYSQNTKKKTVYSSF